MGFTATMNKARWTTSVSLGAALAVGALALPTPSVGAEMMQDKVLRVALPGLPPGKGNPFSGLGAPNVYTWAAMFDALTLVDESGAPQPALAESWRNTDPTTWVFNIKRGLTFSNGEPVTAQAVIATLDWLGSEEGLAKGASSANRMKFIASTRAIDSHTLEIKTATPDPVVPNVMSVATVVAPKAWADLGIDGFADEPAGTGSYKLEEWAGERARLVAFEDSWRPAKIKTIEMIDLPERPTRLQAFLSGQADVMLVLSPDDVAQVRASGAKLFSQASPSVMTWALTQANAKEGVDITPMQDKRVRQALNYAVNLSAIQENILGGIGGQAMGQGVSSVVYGHNPNVKPYPYDPGKARSLLAEAGYGNGLSLVAEIVQGLFPSDSDIFQQVAQDLGAVGVKVEVRTVSFGDWIKKFIGVGWDGSVWVNSWAAAPVMDAMTAIKNQTCDKGGAPYICDERQQALVEKINGEFDPEKRLAMIHELIEIQHEEAVNLFLFEAADINATSAAVTGFRNVNRSVQYQEISFVN